MLKRNVFYTYTVLLIALALTAGAFYGCSYSFTPANAADSVTALCKKEYDIDVKSKTYGKTLWVYLPLEKLVDAKGQIDEKSSKDIQNAVLCTQRVVMSMAEPVNFFVLVASDIKQIGAEFTLICYSFDIKRVRLMDISRGEYQKRILRDLKLSPSAIGDTEGRHIRLSDLDLGKFLAEQLNRRIKNMFQQEQELSARFKYNTSKWYFKDDVFIFNINIAEKKDEPETDAVEQLHLRSSKNPQKQAIDIALDEIAFVLHRYAFEQYDKVRITNFATDETRILTPQEIEDIYQNTK